MQTDVPTTNPLHLDPALFLNGGPLSGRPTVRMGSPGDDLSIFQKGFQMMGITSPFSRFMLGFSLAETTLFILKPSFCYTAAGIPKGFSLWGRDKDKTAVPWYLPGIVIGSSLALFF